MMTKKKKKAKANLCRDYTTTTVTSFCRRCFFPTAHYPSFTKRPFESVSLFLPKTFVPSRVEAILLTRQGVEINSITTTARHTQISSELLCNIYIYSCIVAMLRHQVTAGHLIIFGQLHTQIIIIIFRKHCYNNNINHVALSKYFTVSCSTLQYRTYSK